MVAKKHKRRKETKEQKEQKNIIYACPHDYDDDACVRHKCQFMTSNAKMYQQHIDFLHYEDSDWEWCYVSDLIIGENDIIYNHKSFECSLFDLELNFCLYQTSNPREYYDHIYKLKIHGCKNSFVSPQRNVKLFKQKYV